MKTAAFFCLLLFSSGAELQSEQILPTKLKVTVVDGLGNFVEAASVSIYENEKDYRSGINVVATGDTNKEGAITLKALKLIPHYIEVKKGDRNNNGEGVVTGKLAEGKINKVNTVIE